MITILFCVISIIMIVIQSQRENNYINLISLLMAPYVIFAFINNFFFYKAGFFKISDKVLIMILSAFIAFFVGGLLVSPRGIPIIYEKDNETRFDMYNIEAMIKVVFVVGIIANIRAFFLLRSGALYGNRFSETEGLMGTGPVGHLLLLSYSLTPILFLYWIENKRNIMALLAVISIAIPTFLTFVKYNIIGFTVSIFIFLVLYKKSILKRAVVVLIGITILLFVANYAIGFFVRNATVGSNFYINHFWVYCSGSMIYDNNIFETGVNTGQSTLYKLCIFLFAFPNMFVTLINSGKGIFQHIQKPFRFLGRNGEMSNVVDAIGYIFPSKGSILEIIFFLLIMVVIGFVFTRTYVQHKERTIRFDTFLCNFLTYFVFFSFFGTFYINPGVWEMLIYSLIVPNMFLLNNGLKDGKLLIG